MRKSWDGDGEETRDDHRQYSSARKLSVRVQIRPPNETADRSQSIKAVSQFLRNKLIYYVAGTINQAPSPKPHAGNSSQVLAKISSRSSLLFLPGPFAFRGDEQYKIIYGSEDNFIFRKPKLPETIGCSVLLPSGEVGKQII